MTEGYEPWQKTLIGASAGALSLVTIAGNLMVMISFKMDKQLQTISNYFLFSLAVADFIIGEQTQHFPCSATNQVWNFSMWLEKMSPVFNPAPSSLGMLFIVGIPVAGRQLGGERSSYFTHSLTPILDFEAFSL